MSDTAEASGPASAAPAATVTLDGVPGLGGLYARGVGGSALATLRRTPAGSLLTGRAVLPVSGGLTLPDVTVRVAGVDTSGVATADRLAAYARLVGEPASDALPAGFVHVLAFPVATALMVRDDFPLPLLGMVHVANRVTVHRPVRLGDRLEVRAWARDLRAHRRGVQVEIVTEVRTDPTDDAPAWQGVSTYLAKGVDASGLPGAVEPVDVSGVVDSATGIVPVETVEAVAEGRADRHPRYPTERWPLDAGVGRRYAAVSGDRNPIHLSALSAKTFGFPRAIAHGMYTASRALASVARERGDAYDWTVGFEKPVLLPGTVDVSVVPASGGVDHGKGHGWTFTGWDAKRGARHFTGGVVPR